MRWTPDMKAAAQARHAAERDRLTLRPDETAREYMRRMHTADTGHGDASRRGG